MKHGEYGSGVPGPARQSFQTSGAGPGRKNWFIWLLIFFAVSQRLDAQTVFDEVSVNYYFLAILNEYRQSFGLRPMSMHEGNRAYADAHAQWLASRYDQRIQHSVVPLAGGDRTLFRKVLDRHFSPQTYFAENVASSPVLEKMSANDVKHEYEDVRENYLQMITRGPDNHLVARCAFLCWKNSPEHNAIMLSNDVNRFWLGFDHHKSVYYFVFVATN